MNNFISFTSRLTLAFGLGSGLVASALAQTESYDQAMRELNIMRNIFNASMQDRDKGRFGFGSGDAIYLANQGMVFTFALPGRGWLNMPDLAKLQSLNGNNFDFDFDFDEGDAQVFIENDAGSDTRAFEYQQKMLEFNQGVLEKESEMRQAMSAKQNEMHDLQLQMNAKQREMRELQRQQRQGLAVDNNNEVERLDDELEVLGDEIDKLGDSINESQQTYQADLKAQLATVHQAYAAQIFSTLCNYGNTLRSLGTDQHVSIVLRNHEENQSQVYVVDYSALSSCSSGESLQQTAIAYVQ
jgi:hypothetical protein